MANYLLAYHGGSMPETEAAQAEVMAAWGKWFGELGAAVVDSGNPVGQARTIASSGATTDGGGANPVTGYSIIKADNIESAVAMAAGCPVLRDGASIEVAETFNVM
jgi:hypothetical protein